METEITIEKFSKRGWGVGLYNSSLVEVPHGLVGDKVLVDLRSKRKRLRKGRLLQVLQASKDRRPPKCPHTRLCGGCMWQEYDYSSQLKQKDAWIQEAFSFAMKKGATIYPIAACASPFFYRNKMEFSFSENAAGTKYLGLMIAGANHYVFNLEKCFLAGEWFEKVVNQVRSWWEKSSLHAFRPNSETGELLTLTLREGKNTQEKLVILTAIASDKMEKEVLESFVKEILKILPLEKLSIVLRLKYQKKGSATTWEEKTLLGKGFIFEKYHFQEKEIFMKVSPTSFCQPNTLQAEKLYEKAFELLRLTKEEVLLDLYSGSGSLAMMGSYFAKKVIALELNPFSIEDAKENLKLNQITNVEFLEGDVGKILAEKGLHADALIVDPPRAGLTPLAIAQILKINPKRMVYISCNPISQAKDLESLMEGGFMPSSIYPYDQFPQTAHIENVLLLEKKP